MAHRDDLISRLYRDINLKNASIEQMKFEIRELKKEITILQSRCARKEKDEAWEREFMEKYS